MSVAQRSLRKQIVFGLIWKDPPNQAKARPLRGIQYLSIRFSPGTRRIKINYSGYALLKEGLIEIN